ncbi:hypothetical protein O9929_02845 [Vibrio lentus]|nr:hypothetical protein [Vibrio lentus]
MGVKIAEAAACTLRSSGHVVSFLKRSLVKRLSLSYSTNVHGYPADISPPARRSDKIRFLHRTFEALHRWP